MKEEAPEGPARPPKVLSDRLAEVNGQLTLAALLAQEQAEELTERYREQNIVLERKRAQLRALASDLLLSEQRERKRLAGELHDYLAQMLVLGRLKLGQARSRLAPSGDPSVGGLVGEAEDIFTQALAYTRTLMIQLSPPALQEVGLPRALRELGESMKKHGLSVEVHASHDELSLSDGPRSSIIRRVNYC